MGNSKSNEEISILERKHYQKSNALVNSKGRANLIIQKLLAVGISQAIEDEKTGILSATIRGTDLRKIFKKTNGSFYNQIKDAVTPADNRQTLLDYRVVYTNDDTQKVEAINVVTDCEFENGIFTMRFNNKINGQIHELKSNYTVFSLAETIPLKNVYSFKLYEILKSEYDRQDYINTKRSANLEINPTYIMDIDLVDLKLRLGIINASENDEILRAVKSSNPNYEKINEMASGQDDYIKFQDFAQFRRTVLDKPQKELKENTSICFDYKTIRTGRGGKTTAIRFFIRKNIDTTKEIPIVIDSAESSMETDDKLEILFEIKSALGTDFSMKDARIIAEKANYDFYKVRDALEVLNVSQGEIKNPVAWILKAIEGNYQMPKPKKAKNNFANFEQTSIDFDELEKKLVEN